MGNDFGFGDGFDEDDSDLESSVFNFGEDSGDVSESGSSSGGAVDIPDDAKRGKKKLALILMGIGIVVILVVSAIGGSMKRKAQESENKGSTKNDSSSAQEQQQTATQPGSVSDVLVVDNGWTKIDYLDIELSKQIEGTFIITDKQYFAKQTGDNDTKLELTVRAIGEISGLSGKYTLNIPWRVAESISLGDKINVYYYIGNVNGSRVVLDVSYTK